MSRLTELYDIYKKQGAAQRDADVAASDKMYDTQRRQTQDTYDRQIKDTNNSYEDMYRENAVQRLINERKIAEDMAGLGLTDSGLNRTQQTAVQLSYANSKNKIDTNRQKAVDTLAASLADAVSRIDANKLAAAEKIRSSYESGWNSAAQSTYAKELEEQTQRQKNAYDYNLKLYDKQQQAYEKQLQTEKENNYIIKANGGFLSYGYKGTLKNNGVAVYYETDSKGNPVTRYVDRNSGKSTTMARGVNPYSTGEINRDLLDENGNYDVKKAFSNGYQPNNIGGKKLVKVDTIDLPEVGRTQNVFKTPDGKCWTWNGSENKYAQLKRSGSGWVFI